MNYGGTVWRLAQHHDECPRGASTKRWLYVGERSMVLNRAGRTAQIIGLELHNHERVFWHFVFAVYAKARRRRKPEMRVVGRMAQDNDGTEAELLALFKARAHKCRSDAFALMLWRNSHRCEAHDP